MDLAADALKAALYQFSNVYPPVTLQPAYTAWYRALDYEEQAVDELAGALRAPSGPLPDQTALRAQINRQLDRFRTGLIAWSKQNYTTVPRWVLAIKPPLG